MKYVIRVDWEKLGYEYIKNRRHRYGFYPTTGNINKAKQFSRRKSAENRLATIKQMRGYPSPEIIEVE